jgi:L,D-peptidoglycan transpeptidase YkuD (ErfK/YbiS/YcfS/YnhG family)
MIGAWSCYNLTFIQVITAMDPFCLPLVLQLLVVVSSDWDAVEGTLYRYQRTSEAHQWNIYGSPITIALGKNGMAWGRGLHDLGDQQGLHKQEGDGRSPAGCFSVGPAFGDLSHQPLANNIPFLLITEDLECIDDPDSHYYNQFVYRHTVKDQDWITSEKMIEIGPLYALGLVIQHNHNPIQSGMGSAIFMHIWRGKGMGTAGCTVMEENNLVDIVSWLDSRQRPCLVQLPLEEYRKQQPLWHLPDLP